jgi:hypothetical protein
VDSRGIAVRIAMVHSFYSSSQPSGENTVVLNEVDALRRAGHEVALFAAHTDELEGEVFYKLRSGLRVATGYGRNPLKAIKDFSPDVVHVHNIHRPISRVGAHGGALGSDAPRGPDTTPHGQTPRGKGSRAWHALATQAEHPFLP